MLARLAVPCAALAACSHSSPSPMANAGPKPLAIAIEPVAGDTRRERLADPQILAAMHALDHIPADKLPPRVAKLVADKAAVPPPTIAMQNLAKLWAAGIAIVMGTDAGNIGTLHGPSVFREMALMRDAGLTPLQVLRSATTNGAKAMGRDDLGAIAAGKLADLVVLDADPLADVASFSHAVRVVKGGVVYDPKALVESLR